MNRSLNWNDRINDNAQTKKAYENYKSNPRICAICGCCIWPQPVKCGIVQARIKDCCSLSCASKKGNLKMGHMLNGPKNAKGHARKICPDCGNIRTWQAKKCLSCAATNRRNKHLEKTVEEVLAAKKHDSDILKWKNLRPMLASHARSMYKRSTLPKYCVYCGYDKTIDICHIKAISSFPKTSKIGEINNLDNFIALCPNHHWELDNGKLTLEEIKKAQEEIPEL